MSWTESEIIQSRKWKKISEEFKTWILLLHFSLVTTALSEVGPLSKSDEVKNNLLKLEKIMSLFSILNAILSCIVSFSVPCTQTLSFNIINFLSLLIFSSKPKSELGTTNKKYSFAYAKHV